MGLISFIKKQFIDVLEWTETENGVLAYRFPMQDQEIQNGGKLTVRDSQLALFVNEGRMADMFKPGLYTLNTKNLPILTNLMNWDKAFISPFKSDVYFFSTREQIDRKWGTSTPITLRDKEYGPIRLRAYGIYSFQIKDPKVFYEKVSGSRERYTAEELDGQLRSMTITGLSSFFGSSEIAFVDMAANQTKFSEKLQDVLMPTFQTYGLELKSFFVQSISLPEELQARFDKASSMRMLGDLQRYAQFQGADSISIAAANEGGVAGAGAGLGAGIAMGQAMASSMAGAFGRPGTIVTPDDPTALLEKLYDLVKKGVLTSAEFETKKAELLKKIQ